MADGVLQNPVVHKLIYEIRYDLGFLYLDRCGMMINRILRDHDTWRADGSNPQGGSMTDTETGLQLGMSSSRMSLSHEQSETVDTLVPIDAFALLAEEFTTVVRECLDLQSFSRLGFRVWRLFETRTLEEAKAAIVELGLVVEDQVRGLGIGDLSEVTFGLIVKGERCSTRVAVAAVERKYPLDALTKRTASTAPHTLPNHRKEALAAWKSARDRLRKHAEFAVLVDVDHFVLDPPYPGIMTIAEFISSSFELGSAIASKILGLKGKSHARG